MTLINPLMFPISDGLRSALDAEASKRGTSRAALIRVSIAREIKYDLTKEPVATHGVKKYASPEERKQAQKDRNKAKKLKIDALIRAYEAGDKEEDVNALLASLAGKVPS